MAIDLILYEFKISNQLDITGVAFLKKGSVFFYTHTFTDISGLAGLCKYKFTFRCHKHF